MQSDVVAPTEARHFSLSLRDIQAGEIAPPFTGPLLDGGTFDLTELRGTPVLVMLWADWCPPCPDSLAPFQNVADQWADRVPFVSVLTSKSTPEIAAGIIEEQSFTLPVVIDLTQSLWGASTIPNWVLLDAEGKASAGYGAYTGDSESMAQVLNQLLRQFV